MAYLINASLVRRTAARGDGQFDMLQTVPPRSSDSSASAPRTIGPRSSDGTRIGSSSSPRRQSAISAGRRWNRGYRSWRSSQRFLPGRASVDPRRGPGRDRPLPSGASMWRLWHMGDTSLKGATRQAQSWRFPAPRSEPSLGPAPSPRSEASPTEQNDLPVVRSSYEEALAIALELGDRPMIATGRTTSPSRLASRATGKAPAPGTGRAWRCSSDSAIRGEKPTLCGPFPSSPSSTAIFHGRPGLRRRQRSPTPSPRRRVRARGLATRAGPSGLRDGRPLDGAGELPRIAGDAGTARLSHCHRHRAGQSRGQGPEPGPASSRALRLRGASEDLKESSGGRAPAEFVDLPDPRSSLQQLGDERAADGRRSGTRQSYDLGGVARLRRFARAVVLLPRGESAGWLAGPHA